MAVGNDVDSIYRKNFVRAMAMEYCTNIMVYYI